MHVVTDIGIAFLILCVISFGGTGLFILYANHKRKGAHHLPEQEQENEHMAWVVGLHEETELFFTGSEVSNP